MRLAGEDAHSLWVPLGTVRRSRPLSYGLAVACFGAALGVRFAFEGYLPSGYPFLTFFPAVVAAAFLGGLGPSLVASALSVVAARYFFMTPAGALWPLTIADALALLFFAVVLLVDCVVIHVMTAALERVRRERETSAELARQLEFRLSELRQAHARTEAASRAKSRMMASVGHDLRQPLNVIALAIEVLGQGERDASEQALLARTARNVVGLARTFDQLLESARLDARGFAPQVGPVALAPLLGQLDDEFGALADEKKISLEVAACEGCVESDAAMLLSILRNLVGNAVKYTPPGGTIAVRVAGAPGEPARIEVADDGPGIPDDKLDLIFEEFERLTPGEGDGIGLGLALVKKNAELLGHRLGVDSTPGRGSTFSVTVATTAPAGAR